MSHVAPTQSDLAVNGRDHKDDISQCQRTGVSWYRAASRRKVAIIAGLAALLCAVTATDFLIGSSMTANEAIYVLFHPSDSRPVDRQIIFDIRLPMTITAVLIGAALAAAGAEMQTILGNPLAEPYTLGISAASSFGAAFATVSGFTAAGIGATLGMAGSAWVFGIAACAVIVLFSRSKSAGTEGMILLGIAIVFLFDALLALMQYLASQTQLEQVVFWTMGSLTRAKWPQIGLLALVSLIVIAFFYRNAWTLTAFRMGDDRARSMGINVNRLRTLTLVGVSLMAATAVSMAGTIGFIGLVGPHIARMLVGEDQRFFLTTSIFSGALLLTSASVVSKLIQPGAILPVGIITAIVGVPAFVVLIVLRRRPRTISSPT
ncbi:FecCD family ABC transporter permease [Corynebacterium jeikeium]|uniref:FecCD family ABC transporter permease n=1 Tax=Corynebacterium jeikeium TaxID=38289 RepID=UPI0008817420|nr:iron ABC transporter permease [Corynebacterium jeikeium]SCX24914.1 Hemin transport system permease protein HmuU [Corynebacterium jeikeium]